MEHLSNDHEDHHNQLKNSQKQCDQTRYLSVNMMESQWKLRQQQDQNSEWRESHCRTDTSIWRKKSKRSGLWESQSGFWLGKLTIWVKSFEIITEFTGSICSTKIGESVLMMDAEVSKDKHICRWIDWENLIYVRWNRIKNRAQRWRRRSIEKKEVRNWVKLAEPVEHITKNLQSFLEISLVQKEVLPSHKLRDHA